MMEKLVKTNASMQDGEKNSLGFFIPMQHRLIHLSYETKVGVLFNIGGCITLKKPSDILNQGLAIGQGLKGCITEEFMLKELASVSSVYFAVEHNVSAPTMQYNVDEEPPCSDLSILH
jgi:hypothetical protein